MIIMTPETCAELLKTATERRKDVDVGRSPDDRRRLDAIVRGCQLFTVFARDDSIRVGKAHVSFGLAADEVAYDILESVRMVGLQLRVGETWLTVAYFHADGPGHRAASAAIHGKYAWVKPTRLARVNGLGDTIVAPVRIADDL